MKNRIWRYIFYVLSTIIIFYAVAILIAVVSASMLCGACFMTIYGPNVAYYLGILFVIILLIKGYFINFKKKEHSSIFLLIPLSLVIYLILSVFLIILGDVLRIGGPYGPNF